MQHTNSLNVSAQTKAWRKLNFKLILKNNKQLFENCRRQKLVFYWNLKFIWIEKQIVKNLNNFYVHKCINKQNKLNRIILLLKSYCTLTLLQRLCIERLKFMLPALRCVVGPFGAGQQHLIFMTISMAIFIAVANICKCPFYGTSCWC